MVVMPRAALNRDYKMRVPYELKQRQTRLFHELPSGLNMEVIVQKGLNPKDPDEKRGESDAPNGSVAGSLQTHAGDVADFIQKELMLPSVLIGHSFGGLIVQYYIATMKNEEFSGMMVVAYLSEILLAYPVKLLHASINCCTDFASSLIAGDCRYRKLAPISFWSCACLLCTTFSYQKLMTESSRMPLFDRRKLNASLPVPSVPNSSFKILVLGANDDFIVVNSISYTYSADEHFCSTCELKH
ncbi:hypothetical protein RJ639_031009 [Escallonia herrerae]|uniref:AB hydrolase-1 domain-containing protein n=1 Tax=Escallonia herrerae TaxID=1293975 RepID=A0AA89BDA4_9ASTE|nr:hypothetical protein RJ639_031009 [Escallonia herrerae]